jgi:phage I-like protein
MIESGEYRYVSPVFGWNAQTGAVLSLAMAGLVNNPGLDGLADLSALSALLSSDQLKEDSMDELLEQLRWLLNLPVGATADDIKAQLQKLMDQLGGQEAAASFDLSKFIADQQGEFAALKSAMPDLAQYVPLATHSALSAELASLKSDNHKQEVDRIVTEALAAGKLVPAQESWARDLGEKNIEMLSAFVEKAPVSIVPGATQTGGKKPDDSIDLNDASAIHLAALKYQTEQQQSGVSINIAEAVAHVTRSH